MVVLPTSYCKLVVHIQQESQRCGNLKSSDPSGSEGEYQHRTVKCPAAVEILEDRSVEETGKHYGSLKGLGTH